ncbi:4Fe-4S ferredoxin, iron-sulpur binding domain-containing protein [Candidatus Magnetomorum sp. HK-1]|nr:4Fe-4S ferredoxin, iron-sulpur binding domain-containing protein [Candidatus Magnetomorum sp. HK-1]
MLGLSSVTVTVLEHSLKDVILSQEIPFSLLSHCGMKGRNMSKILLLYHSGSGNTKMISNILKSKLAVFHETETQRIHLDFDYDKLLDYDFILLGFPTYFWEPSTSISEFVSKMPVYGRLLKSFVYTTCGLYNGNSLRILIKKLYKKNIITTAHTSIKGPASDYIVFPISTPSMFEYESHLLEKIDQSVQEINELINNKKITFKVPAFKWYVPINNINKYPGKKFFYYYRDKLHVLEDRCINCNTCVKNCERNCLAEGENLPIFNSKNCEFCLKCVHNCPKKAIIFSEKMIDKVRFNKQFYTKLIKKITKGVHGEM